MLAEGTVSAVSLWGLCFIYTEGVWTSPMLKGRRRRHEPRRGSSTVRRTGRRLGVRPASPQERGVTSSDVDLVPWGRGFGHLPLTASGAREWSSGKAAATAARERQRVQIRRKLNRKLNRDAVVQLLTAKGTFSIVSLMPAWCPDHNNLRPAYNGKLSFPASRVLAGRPGGVHRLRRTRRAHLRDGSGAVPPLTAAREQIPAPEQVIAAMAGGAPAVTARRPRRALLGRLSKAGGSAAGLGFGRTERACQDSRASRGIGTESPATAVAQHVPDFDSGSVRVETEAAVAGALVPGPLARFREPATDPRVLFRRAPLPLASGSQGGYPPPA
jgi:hypothetical protein